MRLPRCQRCGACCSHPYDPEWIELTAKRAALIHPAFRQPTQLDWSPLPQPPYVMRQTDSGQCAALIGQIGCSVHCVVYPERPDACRRLRRGSALCRSMIKLHGIREPQ